MNKLELNNFKAFLSSTAITFDGNNALFYGENGSGKSSIYDAIKLWFYTNKLFERNIDPTLTSPIEKKNAKDDFMKTFNNQTAPATDFSIKLNNTQYNYITPTVIPNLSAFMIERADLEFSDSINVLKLLTQSMLGINDVSNFIKDKYSELSNQINKSLHKYFSEPNISVDITRNGTDWFLQLADHIHNITQVYDLKSYFNEGKLHLIIILLLLESIKMNDCTDLKKVLVLDDLITSMDAANRTLFINYIHHEFNAYQKIIFTHSISFYNQISYSFRNVWNEFSTWKCFKVVDLGKESTILEESSKNSAKQLRKDFKKYLSSGSSSSSTITNNVRKRFEYLIQEISNMLCIGGISECSEILKLLNTEGRGYCYYYDSTTQKAYNIYDMVNELSVIIRSFPKPSLAISQLTYILDKYNQNESLNYLKGILQQLMIYQKVTMHAGSHHMGALPSITNKELDISIALLADLEKLMNKLENRDIYSF